MNFRIIYLIKLKKKKIFNLKTILNFSENNIIYF